MLKSKLQYILTWVTILLLLISGFGLMVMSWNGAIGGSPSPSQMIILWVIMSASGIYLFMFAVKKAHKQWIHDERRKKQKKNPDSETHIARKGSSQKEKALDFASTARKLSRKFPEKESYAKSGQELLTNLAKELEIMSGVFYAREKDSFLAVATYALASASEPYSFKEGEGLSGQAAANQQIMLLSSLPEGHLQVYSGLGKAEPSYLAIVPLVYENRTIAVLECSGYRYDPHDVETMFRIFARDVMTKLSPHIK